MKNYKIGFAAMFGVVALIFFCLYAINERDVIAGEQANIITELEQTNIQLLEELEQIKDELNAANQLLEKEVKEKEKLKLKVSKLKNQLRSRDEEIMKIKSSSTYMWNGNWNYKYNEEDVKILAGVMYGENYISGRWEMMLTGSVVLNRIISDKFPNTVKDVVYQFDGKYEQYAPRTKRLIGSKEVTKECYDLARILLEYGPVAPEFVVYQAHFNQGKVYWEWKGEEFCYK